jgi:hypothetical protein
VDPHWKSSILFADDFGIPQVWEHSCYISKGCGPRLWYARARCSANAGGFYYFYTTVQHRRLPATPVKLSWAGAPKTLIGLWRNFCDSDEITRCDGIQKFSEWGKKYTIKLRRDSIHLYIYKVWKLPKDLNSDSFKLVVVVVWRTRWWWSATTMSWIAWLATALPSVRLSSRIFRPFFRM